MDNKPKKSKAVIITIIAILIIVLIGYLLVKNRDIFGSKTSNAIARIFAPLITSDNEKGLKQGDENSKKVIAQADENIKDGDNVTKTGTDENNNPTVSLAGRGDTVFGYANGDINAGNLGEIILYQGGSNTFWESFSNFLNNLFGNQSQNNIPQGGWIYSNGVWSYDPSATGGWIYNYSNGTWNPPEIGWEFDPNTGNWNPPNIGGYTPACSDTIDNDSDELIDEEDPECHIDGDLEKEYVPDHYSESSSSNSWEFKDSDLTAGAISPTSTTINTFTYLYATIKNEGEGSTGYNFSSFFTITNKTNDNTQIEDTSNDTVSKTSNIFKRLLSRIPKVTKTTASDDDIELSVVTPLLPAKSNTQISVNYEFTSAGTYYIRACADKRSSSDTGTIIETNENNNCGPWTTFIVTNSLPTTGDLPECSDTIDNDSDGLIDVLDPDCHNDNNIYMPNHDDESGSYGVPVFYECNDGIDNDEDNFIDEEDKNCHLDGDLNKEYLEFHNDESSSQSSNEEEEVNKCLLIENTPLEFTDEEKARLAVLLRKFYLISSTLRTSDDIVTIYNEIDQQNNFIAEVKDLTKQCYLETDFKEGFIDFCKRNPKLCDSNTETEFYVKNNDSYYDRYYGKRHDILRGNPWFSKSNSGSLPYSSSNGDFGYLDPLFLEGNYTYGANGNAISSFIGNGADDGCKVVTGYYYGKTTKSTPYYDGTTTHILPKGGDCSVLNIPHLIPNFLSCYHVASKRGGNDNNPPHDSLLEAGCKWKEGVLLGDTERILNIW